MTNTENTPINIKHVARDLALVLIVLFGLKCTSSNPLGQS
jgi:hypothetical protein